MVARIASYTLEQFTPAEASEITGVTPVLQRDWRRRGLLPASKGPQARYTAAEMVELLLMKDFSDEKFGPKLLRELLDVSSFTTGEWVDRLSGQGGFDGVGFAPPRYVVFSGSRFARVDDLNKALDDLAQKHGRRLSIVCDLKETAQFVISRLPRPVWRASTEV